ncbi:thioesterase II family protein [Amycolatopsis alba]|uniref:Thioesterase n=1 Tax=Amycolatopsis alba DSM 44262 TaxID=1125972 RepID=A0A229REJ8_AMYAL|nr:alpha/beta fold hydrolase [Amycolatopsis alba]OXM45005.1 thioesterase [Amycolatopsis alba DSM 44262]
MTEWLRHFSRSGRARARLLCLPPGGGSARIYQNWGEPLGAEIDVVGVELPGRGDRGMERPITDMAELIDGVLPELDGLDELPLVVFGHSMGAVVAWELCRTLRATRGWLPEGLVVAAAAAPGSLHAPNWRSETSDEGLIELITRAEGLPADTPPDPLFLEYILPILRADLTVVNEFRPEPRPPLRCDLRVYLGADDPLAGEAEAVGWLAEVEGTARVSTFPGGHFFPRDNATSMLTQLRQDILGCTGLTKEVSAPWHPDRSPRTSIDYSSDV